MFPMYLPIFISEVLPCFWYGSSFLLDSVHLSPEHVEFVAGYRCHGSKGAVVVRRMNTPFEASSPSKGITGFQAEEGLSPQKPEASYFY